MERQKCPTCGKFISTSATYCPYCTTKLKDEPLEEELLEEDTDVVEDTPSPLTEKTVNENSAVLEEEVIPVEVENDDILEDGQEITEELPEDDIIEEGFEDNFDEVAEEDDELTEEEIFSDEEPEDSDFEKYMVSSKPSKKPSVQTSDEKKKIQGALNNPKRKTTAIPEQVEKTIHKDNRYDPDEDGYYSAKKLIENIDAELDGIPKENILKTVGIFVAMIVIIVYLIFNI